MARGRLFEYAVLFHPARKSEKEEQKKSEIVTDVSRVLATTDAEVAMLAARSIPEKFLDKLDQIEIIVRPFN